MNTSNYGNGNERILDASTAALDSPGPGPHLMGAATLTGDKVVNEDGEDLGSIEKIMLDVNSGSIAYAVLSFGGLLGVGDKLFAIPWIALKLDPLNHRFVLNVSKERLEAAPGFNKNHWPAMAEITWAENIHTYYGSRPYWDWD